MLPQTVSVGVQCDILKPLIEEPTPKSAEEPAEEPAEEQEQVEEVDNDDKSSDPDYCPSDEEESDDEEIIRIPVTGYVGIISVHDPLVNK